MRFVLSLVALVALGIATSTAAGPIKLVAGEVDYVSFTPGVPASVSIGLNTKEIVTYQLNGSRLYVDGKCATHADLVKWLAVAPVGTVRVRMFVEEPPTSRGVILAEFTTVVERKP